MPKTLTARTNRSFAKLAVLLFVIAFLVAALLVTQPVKATSRFSCPLIKIEGGARMLSCGSSAGNFFFSCIGGVCTDDVGTNPNNQSFANQLCEQYERDGCPGALVGTPFIDLESPPVN